MNRLLFLSFLLLPIFCSSQTYSLCMQVIASNGGSGAQGNYNVSWTVGELAVSTLSGTDSKLTQGFHQPDVCTPVSTWNLDLEALSIEVFPNPTNAFLTIRYSDVENAALSLSAFDVLGTQVLSPMPLDTPSGNSLDISNWPPGVYFLKIMDNDSKAATTVRVIRL
jgi:Secretion system C-terminal sorting domain